MAPSVWHIFLELIDVLGLLPHVGDGKLGPLWHPHGCHLVVPEYVLLTTEDLVQESNGTVLLIRQEDVLKRK